MSLYFKAWQPKLPKALGKWYPRLVKKTKVKTSRDIAKKASRMSSLTVGDMLNAIDCIMETLRDELLDGYTVKFEGLGNFTMVASAKGAGVDTPEEVNASQINGLKIRFTPSYTINPIEGITRAMFEGISFERIDKPKSGSNPGGTTNPGDGGNGGNPGDGGDGGSGWTDPTG